MTHATSVSVGSAKCSLGRCNGRTEQSRNRPGGGTATGDYWPRNLDRDQAWNLDDYLGYGPIGWKGGRNCAQPIWNDGSVDRGVVHCCEAGDGDADVCNEVRGNFGVGDVYGVWWQK